ncbi:SWIM zinc finger family protein [Streptomyces sp. NPDC018833]|uniref:SWIM zinc finger family protein n=1 Tax=Streptomyces sp. NPDC018833 TaxID=3365053 RepID=UPI00379E9261
MNQQGVRWTSEQVLSLAPDDASRKAGNKLSAAGPWSGAGCDGSGAVWGLCKGSGSRPYQTVVDTTGPAYTCSCPSRKFPCKHAIGLLLLWSGDERAVQDDAVPDWADTWLAGRRKRAADKEAGVAGASAPAKSADPEAARRRAERRAGRITAGATELEQRLADLLRGGLASAEQSGYGLWEETAARMVDAQAPGLAARVRELGAIPGSGPGWPVRLLEECALIHLLDSAWLGRERLPESLAATVRTRVGLPSTAEGDRIRDHWLILAQYDSSDGKLTTRRIWLHGREAGRTALLLSFGAAGRSPQLALPVGLMVEAEITTHGGSAPLRAELGELLTAPVPIVAPPPGGSCASAVEAYGSALRDDPWLDSWPVTLSGVIPVATGDGWQLADARGGHESGAGDGEEARTGSGAGHEASAGAGADGGTAGRGALPLAASALSGPGLWKLVSLAGGRPVTVFGEFGHRGFVPLTAWREDLSETVPLI